MNSDQQIERSLEIEKALSVLEFELAHTWAKEIPDGTGERSNRYFDLQCEFKALQKEYKRLNGRYYSSG